LRSLASNRLERLQRKEAHVRGKPLVVHVTVVIDLAVLHFAIAARAAILYLSIKGKRIWLRQSKAHGSSFQPRWERNLSSKVHRQSASSGRLIPAG
jgi:hypothetical protein